MKFSKGAMVALGGAAALLIGFFMPWLSMSYASLSYNFSGMDMAQAGTSSESLVSMSSSDMGFPPAMLWLIPVAAVVILIVVFMASQDSAKSKMAGMATLVSSLVAAAVVGIAGFKLQQGISEARDKISSYSSSAASSSYASSLTSTLGNISIGFGIGFWLSVLGAVAVLVGAFMLMTEGKASATPTAATQ